MCQRKVSPTTPTQLFGLKCVFYKKWEYEIYWTVLHSALLGQMVLISLLKLQKWLNWCYLELVGEIEEVIVSGKFGESFVRDVTSVNWGRINDGSCSSDGRLRLFPDGARLDEYGPRFDQWEARFVFRISDSRNDITKKQKR